MKKTVLAAFGALFAMAGLHSCLDFDMPTDTFTGGDTELDPIVYKGKADSIDFRRRFCVCRERIKQLFLSITNGTILYERRKRRPASRSSPISICV